MDFSSLSVRHINVARKHVLIKMFYSICRIVK